MESQTFTAEDRALIRSLQSRLGLPATGAIDTELLLELDETLAVATKFFTRLFQPDRVTTCDKTGPSISGDSR